MGFFTRTKRSSTSSSAASTAPNSGITTPTAIDNLTHSPTHHSTTTSSHISTSPTFPLSKTPSRLTLTKTLTWGKRSKEDKYRRRIESWEREDQNEWDAPTARPHGRRRKLGSKKEQEVLRAFEWKVCGEGRDSIDGGKSRSCFSGVSPGCSRMGSVDDGCVGLSSMERERMGSGLVRESSRSDSSGEGSVVRAASEE
ncbi:hypothetical protein ONS95_008430 [Cadophora gregata]|uniref:uncharacterized protein n=1 Tax=Cadophora gregata TaxID=51156 RepID=UPI0026DAABBC|nr:uncharacterized protein ONS95_008430 [Cadophora gregata]KAK0100481.1 hypothetical protein ONS96_007757 [Cadophora gregata f. sp. sojae]KAK0126851.1 hypothetical protein ONS95_008430 [Cadophora gregata]